jgi:hypothetical protein
MVWVTEATTLSSNLLRWIEQGAHKEVMILDTRPLQNVGNFSQPIQEQNVDYP